jgi:hypothetical protein
MSPKQTFNSLTIYFIYVLFFLFLFYIITLNRRSTQYRTCYSNQCIGNMSCPCCRRVMLQNDNNMNIRRNYEYFQPEIGSDFTQYLDQVRKNQLKFSNQ